ncbi:hypothetical protein P4050_00680 [Pseudomonas aeruginosa]|nr:hypothetical protein [Pseudomonas aeruginosa]
MEEIKAQDLARRPGVAVGDFTNWIGMGEDHETVRGWIRRGYLPARSANVMVNVALFTRSADGKGGVLMLSGNPIHALLTLRKAICCKQHSTLANPSTAP